MTRPSCLDSVPEYVEDCLRSCPRAGNGVHQWMARAAYRTFGHLDADEQTRAIRWAMRDCGRLPQPNEIERTISNICGRMANGGCFGSSRPWPSPNHAEIDAIVRRGKGLPGLRRRSRAFPSDASPFFWIEKLFPPQTLVCMASEVFAGLDVSGNPVLRRAWHTRMRDNSHRHDLEALPLMVPNTARWTWGWTKGPNRHRSTRCDDMFRNAGFSSSSSTFPQTGLEFQRGTLAPLCSRICRDMPRSSSPSGQEVRACRGWFDEDSREFFEYACALGADPATWTRCQLVRAPQAIRWNGNRQTVEFFKPCESAGSHFAMKRQNKTTRRESEVACKWGKGRIIHRHWVIGARRFFRDWR